jgi:hypothetical protein
MNIHVPSNHGIRGQAEKKYTFQGMPYTIGLISTTLFHFSRAISDASRHLDDRRGRAQTCIDLFSPNVETQRVKLREYCERLIFSDPVGYGRKGEELLWRKGYYDVVTTAKRLRKV